MKEKQVGEGSSKMGSGKGGRRTILVVSERRRAVGRMIAIPTSTMAKRATGPKTATHHARSRRTSPKKRMKSPC
jgi:hypothetical protein